ncbi:hypothetical protein roselon_00673 [Roseibacterium elongatum DSM 19469]|uniref:Lipoprotein n=1 Tax=Roseicyclus elongatus DSM 19469 TaxID=1294273 RepID=W8S2Y2_9RHOB|nr:hypothetical protein [Roseibacterium elongatum]AHM03106.1 hypothetical protein roselon_00673 [Roseibacterium elongatum DSM 19469]
MRRVTSSVLALALVGALAGCEAPPNEGAFASDEFVSQSRYVPPGSPTVTLLTMIYNDNGRSGHSALLIDGPEERVLFDPAGSWHHPVVPERNDVLYGMTPQLFGFYMDYHARETVDVHVHEIDVAPEIAAQLIDAVEAYGQVGSARCAYATSEVLSQTPGFETITRRWYPTRVMADFAQLPGVRESIVLDDDSDDNLELLQAQAAQAARLERARALLSE